MTILHYKIFTPENILFKTRTPLFILHGLLGSLDNWQSQAKYLSQFRPVITLDLRNHGNSPHLKGMSYREMYEDVINVAKSKNILIFHLLGHSMGGKVAMQLALAKPNMIKSLIVVDIAPKPYPLWHQKTLQGVLSAPLDTFTSRKEINEYLSTWIENSNERAFILKNIKQQTVKNKRQFIWRCNLQEISRGYLKIAGFISTQQQYQGKTLFIRGNDSDYILEADAPLIHSLFPNVEITTINDSDHLPHIQQAIIFQEITQRFLNK